MPKFYDPAGRDIISPEEIVRTDLHTEVINSVTYKIGYLEQLTDNILNDSTQDIYTIYTGSGQTV